MPFVFHDDGVFLVMKNRMLLLFGLFAAVSQYACGAVPVKDIGEMPVTREPAAPAAVASAPLLQEEPVDSFTKMQMLQNEVMELRGMIEQLSNEVQQLKQRQMDDYMDLDRRLSGNASTPESQQSEAPATSQPTATVNVSPSNQEANSYNAAYNLLKAGKVDSAVAAFRQHIDSYPAGSYTPNSHYWLGEIYLLKNDLELARQSFTMVSENYPAHRKAADATFKLGKVYHLQGDNEKARSLLKKVAAGNGSAASLAQRYLNENF